MVTKQLSLDRQGLSPGFHLKEKHVRPDIWDVQKVSLATQVLSRKTANMLPLFCDEPDKSRCQALASFCLLFNDMFDRLNSLAGEVVEKRRPVTKDNKCEVQQELHMYISRLQAYRNAFPEFDGDRKVRLADITLDDWITTLQSSIEYIEILLEEKGFEFVQMRRINSDFVEVCRAINVHDRRYCRI